MVCWWTKFFLAQFFSSLSFFPYKLQYEEPYKHTYLIPVMFRRIYNPDFIILKRIIQKNFGM